jgi:predicted MFS family arabinose efflux permease
MPHEPAIRRLMWFFAIVYTVEGIGQAKVGVLWQPLTHFLKETQGWTTVQISVSLAVLDVPWMVKPLYGLVSDVLPLFGYRRRGYLVVANAAAVAAFVWVAGLTAPALIVPALVVTAVAMAVSSTICGALLVEAGQRHDASGAFVNQQWLWFNVAVTAMSLLGGLLTEHLSPAGALHAAAWIAAVAPVAILGSLTLVHEERVRLDRPALRQRLRGLMSSLRSRRLWLIAGFLFCYYFSPGLGTPLYFHLTDRLGFSQGFSGVLASVSACGWIAGGLLYRRVLARLAPRTLLTLSILSGAGSTLLYLGLSGPASAVAV